MTVPSSEQETTTQYQTRGPSPALVLLLIMGLLGLIAAGVMILNDERRSTELPTFQPEPPRSLRDWQAPEFELITLEGQTVRLSDFSGRPIFLNFWRTDCPPCVREMPAFQEFMEAQAADGPVVLAINQGERAGEIASFLESINITSIPILLDPDMALTRDYPITGLPTTYLIDTAGMVRYLKIGEMHLDEMYTYLESLGDTSSTLRG